MRTHREIRSSRTGESFPRRPGFQPPFIGDRRFSRFHHGRFDAAITPGRDIRCIDWTGEDKMLPPRSLDWPLWNGDRDFPQAGPGQLRHDVALAAYLQDQAMRREGSTAPAGGSLIAVAFRRVLLLAGGLFRAAAHMPPVAR
jgi:hypothetical protein